jgi:hypothetical protein
MSLVASSIKKSPPRIRDGEIVTWFLNVGFFLIPLTQHGISRRGADRGEDEFGVVIGV